MKKFIRNKPVYLFLLSLFFVFHGYTENYDYITAKDALVLVFIYLASSLVITGILWILYRNFSKSNLVSFLLMGFYFFFGYIYDNLYKLFPDHFISRYGTIIVSGFLFILTVFIILFFTKRSLQRLNYFLNVFFILVLIIDAGWLMLKMVQHKKFDDNDFKKQFAICDTCSKPDIYFIIPDLYAGEQEMKETMNFDNTAFREQLTKRGFHYIPDSKSNYNFTHFSVASTLQMEYLSTNHGSNTNHEDLSYCYKTIRENRTVRILIEHGYQLENFSIYDTYNQPSLIKKSILPERTKFITAQTLLYRLQNDFRFNLGRFQGARQRRKRLYIWKDNNEKLYNLTMQIKPGINDKPRFVFTHLMMPHYPYYFNKDGIPAPENELHDGREKNLTRYTEYLQYTNQKLLTLVDSIFIHSHRPPVILLLSDHGFREFPDPVDNKYHYMNLAAVFLPDGNYSSFYDGMSNVNIFRAIFNTQFHQKFPMLKDSTCYIRL